MRDVIEGKIYNTETADEIGSWDNGLGCRDFRHEGETLYRTPKGAFFTVGYGGPMTKYARACGNMTGGDSNVFRVMDEAEALSWCERHDVDVDTMNKLFSLEAA